MYREIFTLRIKKAREMSGFTQVEVSKELEIPQPTLSGYESGKHEPSVENIGKLADFYGVSIDWLFGTGAKNNNEKYYKEFVIRK